MEDDTQKQGTSQQQGEDKNLLQVAMDKVVSFAKSVGDEAKNLVDKGSSVFGRDSNGEEDGEKLKPQDEEPPAK